MGRSPRVLLPRLSANVDMATLVPAIFRFLRVKGVFRMGQPELNQSKMEAFGGRALDILNKASVAVMMSVGHRTGLFEAMAGLPSSTARQIADSAGLQERYVREWLGAMVTGNVVEHDPENGTYYLPPEHSAFLTKAAQTNNIASFAQVIPLISNVEDEVVACFQHGGGVPYSSFRRFPEVMRELSAPTFRCWRPLASWGLRSTE